MIELNQYTNRLVVEATFGGGLITSIGFDENCSSLAIQAVKHPVELQETDNPEQAEYMLHNDINESVPAIELRFHNALEVSKFIDSLTLIKEYYENTTIKEVTIEF